MSAFLADNNRVSCAERNGIIKHILFIMFAALVFTGCEGAGGKLKLVAGNFYFSRGMINKAIGAYLEAGEEESISAYANFALGVTYLTLEQIDAARERFTRAEQTLPAGAENLALLYRIRYNNGVAYFQLGDYAAAADAFRGALETDHSSREAKRNLELSLISGVMQSQASDINAGQTETVVSGRNDRNDIIFDYVRQKEHDRWKSFQWTGEPDNTGPDY